MKNKTKTNFEQIARFNLRIEDLQLKRDIIIMAILKREGWNFQQFETRYIADNRTTLKQSNKEV